MNVTFKYKDGQFCVAKEALAANGLVRLPGVKDYFVLQEAESSFHAVPVGRPAAIDDDVFVATSA